MRLRRLDLIAFGHFTDVSVDLQRAADLHLILGANEAGKSTARRAILQLLYGIPVHTDLAFLHPMNRLRVGAVIEGPGGEVLEVVRRKGRQDTLRTAQDEPMPEGRLTSLLGGVSQKLFETMLAIDHDQLVAGGDELLRGEGEVGRSLYGAAVGGGRVHSLLAELEAQASDLYLPRGTRTLNRAIADLDTARKHVRELQLRPQQWLTLERAAADAQAVCEGLHSQVLAVDAQAQRLRRLAAAMPLLARRERLLERVAQLGDVPDLPVAVTERYRTIVERLRTGEERERATTDQLAEEEAAIAAIDIDERLLAKVAEVRRIVRNRGRYEKDAKDRDALRGRQEETISQAGALLRQAWPEMTVEVADKELRLTTAERERLDEEVARHPVLQTQCKLATQAAARTGRELERLRARLRDVGEPPDPAPLRLALERSRQDRRLTRSASDIGVELTGVEREGASLVARLGLAGRRAEDAATLPVPLRERVTQFGIELMRIDQESGTTTARQTELRAKREDLQTRLRALGLSRRVPSMEDLRGAREIRDSRWELVKRAWLDGEDVRAAAGADTCKELADTYASTVAAADETADDLREAGERVVQAAQARAELEAVERELTALASTKTAIDADRARLDDRWLAEWAAVGIRPASAEQMQSWLDRHAQLVEVASRISALREQAAAATAAMEGHRRAIADAFARLGVQPSAEEPLEDLQARAEEVSARLAGARQERAQLLAGMGDVGERQREQAAELQVAEAELVAWDTGWRRALEPLRLPGETTPRIAAAALKRLDEAIVKINESNVLRARREGIRRDMREYESAVAALAVEIALDLCDLPAAAAAAELEERLTGNRDRAAQRKEHIDARDALETRRGSVTAALEQDRNALAELMAQLGACTRDELALLIERATERRDVVAEAIRCESEILQQGSGWTVERHVQEAADTSPEQVAAELGATEERLAALREGHQEAIRQTATAKLELSRLDGSAAAAEAAEDAEERRARAAGAVSRFVRLRVAHAVLSQEIDRYRESHQAPVLRGAGEVFREITLGRYTRLREDTDSKGRLVIVAVSADGDERTVAQMSAGTRDQLFLALRLATLTVHFEANPPMPVVLDDILVNFDDDRSRATLRVLASLARRTQVLLLTHHERLLELARASLPSDEIAEHMLPASGKTGELGLAHSAA